MGFFRGPNIVRDNLQILLDAGSLRSYSGSGTVWHDLSGNNYDATLVNGPTFSSDNNGVIIFDGTNDYATINVNSWIRSASSSYTLSSFFYYNDGSNGGAPFSVMTSPNDSNNNDGFWQHLNLGNWLWRTEDNSAGELGGNVESPSTFSNGNWYHIAVVIKTNQLLFYRNGSLVNTINTTFSWSNLRSDGTVFVYISTGYGEFYPMNGRIANFHMYKRELTSSEILQNYNAQKRRFGL